MKLRSGKSVSMKQKKKKFLISIKFLSGKEMDFINLSEDLLLTELREKTYHTTSCNLCGSCSMYFRKLILNNKLVFYDFSRLGFDTRLKDLDLKTNEVNYFHALYF